ncbi:hypothetical protein C0Q70_13097 [Pomacea canaliculata]|uniref:Glycoside hydrolase family 5 domain-containing protein n=1 Tax=Pomacea canaliculata TaxID=400727 RepID=A0A2T7NWA5_POMCA|nr:hypothetical protein C0Q70_13097 [Pomacea canaliculata]
MLRPVVLVFLALAGSALGGFLSRSGTDIWHNGERIFLSGANTAWVSYAYDFGNNQYQYRRDRYIYLMDKVKEAGGNSMRTWVHIEGQTSPKFDSSGHVSGLDNDGTFISDFKRYLDDARARNILIFPTLWNGAVHQRNELGGLITVESKLQSYIDKALKPWVQAVKDHPALGGWDIINEMEGIIKAGEYNSEPCFDTRSWAAVAPVKEEKKDKEQETKVEGKKNGGLYFNGFINWQADAIKQVDSSALVTAGSWTARSNTDNWGNRNFYSDNCLTKAGGRGGGTLTFYSTHTYDWQGNFPQESPFKHSFNDFGLDKPLVVAEFNHLHGGGMSIEDLFRYAYDHGYDGAWTWHANADGSDTDDTDTQMRGIAALRGRVDFNGRVPINL